MVSLCNHSGVLNWKLLDGWVCETRELEEDDLGFLWCSIKRETSGWAWAGVGVRVIVNRGSRLCVLCTGWNAERYAETCLTSSTTECTATQTLPQKQQWAMTTPTGGQEDAGRLKHKQDGQAGRWVCGMKRITKEDFSVSSVVALAIAQHLLNLNLKPELRSGEMFRSYKCSLRDWSCSSVSGLFP